MQETTFRESLQIQKRVIVALIQRDFISVYGRQGLGFLMLFIEPLVIMGCITAFISYRRLMNSTSFPVMAFALSGWGVMWICRYPINRVAGAVFGGVSFLYHRNIKVLDLLASRSIMLLCGTASSFILLFVVYRIVFGEEMYDMSFCILAFFLVCWYSFFMTMITGILVAYAPMGEKWMIIFSIIHAFCTGAFFMVAWLPQKFRDIILFLPLVNVTEMMRYGMFGDRVQCYFWIGYPIFFNLCTTFLVLYLLHRFSRTRSIYGASN